MPEDRIPQGVRAQRTRHRVDPPGTSALPNNSLANSGVQVSTARSNLTPPSTTPHGGITNNRRRHTHSTTRPCQHTTPRDPPDSFHFFRNSLSVVSQWYLCDIEHEGVGYNCAGQMMIAQKAALLGDRDRASHPNHP